MLNYLHPKGEYISDIIRETQKPFEIELLEYISKKYGNLGGTWVDVGANIGNHTRWFLDNTNAVKVVAIEPHPANYELLIKNCPDAQVEKIAASNKCHLCSLKTSWLENMGTFSMVDGEDIEAFPLDYLGLENVKFLKIDVEGKEALVLEGFLETISRDHPVIFAEALKISTLYPMIELLSSVGYSLTAVHLPGSPTFEFQKIFDVGLKNKPSQL